MAFSEARHIHYTEMWSLIMSIVFSYAMEIIISINAFMSILSPYSIKLEVESFIKTYMSQSLCLPLIPRKSTAFRTGCYPLPVFPEILLGHIGYKLINKLGFDLFYFLIKIKVHSINKIMYMYAFHRTLIYTECIF